MLRPLSGATDMIILPEMWATGFSMNVGNIAGFAAETLSWMRKLAERSGAVVTGTVAVEVNLLYYNRMYWVSPEGDTGYYDKHHLFGMSDESTHFTSGQQRCRFNWKGWEICPVVCYDLRFPAWCRNTKEHPYDLLICPASWPLSRGEVWKTLLKARAMENQCFVAGVNRTGIDGNGLAYRGDSSVYSPKGELIGQLPENGESAATFALSLPDLNAFREKFAVLNDMDLFSFL
jgi:predicted amidohydrolase